MLSSLRAIGNPLTRSITAASASFAMVILIAAVALGLPNPKDKSANKIGIYASLLAFVVGAGTGLVVRDKSSGKSKQAKSPKSKNDTWKNWRDFKVARKQVESEEITSFYLQPVDGKKLPDFKPGQYLTIKLDIGDRPIIRTYSLSDYPELQHYYRLSIKREGSPKGLDVPAGVASNFMHDCINEGSVISCKPPNGKFYLEVDNPIPAVLISNGVGITPMISMAKAVARNNPQRHVWFVHGARNGEYHACREEVNQISNSYSYPNLHIYYSYSRPRPEDEKKYHSQGYVDKQLLVDTIIPEIESTHNGSADAEYFLCGSPAFMDSIKEGLNELGVSEDKVYFESFGGGKTKGKVTANSSSEGSVESAEVVFAQSHKTLTWMPKDGTLLEFAEANNLNPEFSCRQGICLTCMCKIEEGEVEYFEDPSGEPDEGEVLICISKPKTNKVVLDL